MHLRATSMMTAGIWAMALPAQVPPQLADPAPPAPAVRPETKNPLREFMKRYGQLQRSPQDAALRMGLREPHPAGTGVCSIPLLEAPLTKDIARMPVLRPRSADEIGRMPFVKLPAPPCGEEQR